jgi:serine protease Do
MAFALIGLRFQFKDSLPRLWLVGFVSLFPTVLLAQSPAAFRMGQAVAFEAMNPEFAATGSTTRAAAEFEPTVSFGRSSLGIQAALKPITSNISPSVVEIRSVHDLISLGTVVSAEGLIVCKHSELSEDFYCVLPNGGKYWGRLIGIHPQKDLELIQIAANHLTPIVFCHFEAIEPGSLVVSVGQQEKAVGFGLVSMPPHDFGLKQPKCKDCIDLGVTVSPSPMVNEDAPENETRSVSGLEVLRVYPRTAAESSCLLVGDLLAAINGIELTSRGKMNEVANSIQIGQILTLRVVRNGKPVLLSTKVKSFASPTLHDRWGGGPYSDRRFGFPAIIAHDSVVLPQHCGSPLVGLDGRVIGINIARSMRVATFSIPIQEVFDFVRLVRPDAPLQLESAAVSGAGLPR